MRFGAVGDLHGDFDALDRIMARHLDVEFWVCPGDLAGEGGEYPRPRRPLYWIKGNNENFDFVAAQQTGVGAIAHLHYIANGISMQAPGGLTLAGLGGTLAPTLYERTPAELAEASTKSNDRRRHFVRSEVEACKRLTAVDVFLSHEAARPFLLTPQRKTSPSRPIDAGKTPINEVLSAMRPRVHVFGHHHTYIVAERQQVPSIGLDLASASYLIFDGESLTHQRMTT
jgi:Icc-related predicted phosphoesterase